MPPVLKPRVESSEVEDLLNDERLIINAGRVAERSWLIPRPSKKLSRYSVDELTALFSEVELPHAQINRPSDLFNDPHLIASGGLAHVEIPEDGSSSKQVVVTRTPLLPFTLNDQRMPLRHYPPPQ